MAKSILKSARTQLSRAHHFGETQRDPDGLAISSRNRYLTATERGRAVSLWKTLCAEREKAETGAPLLEVMCAAGCTFEAESAGMLALDYLCETAHLKCWWNGRREEWMAIGNGREKEKKVEDKEEMEEMMCCC